MKILTLWLSISTILSAADLQVVEQIVAKVNGEIITKGELERSGQSLGDQIDTMLLIQKSRDLGINVDPDVTRELAEIQGATAKIADADKFRAWLQEQTGMSYEDFGQQLKTRQLQQRVVREEVGRKIVISNSELRQYYDEHRQELLRREEVFLREILISSTETRAQDILARLRMGERFSEVARDNSESESARNYGEIGWFTKDRVIPALQDTWPQLQKGYVTGIIQVENGFAIFKVEERHEAGVAPFEEVENEINEKLYVSRVQSKMREYLTKLREQAFLEIREGYVDTGAAPGKDTGWRDPAHLEPETTTKEESSQRRRLLGVVPWPRR